MASRADEAIAFATEIYGAPVDRVDRLVQSSVRAIRLHIGAESVIAARRPSEARATLEATVLSALRTHGAPVPALIERRGRWVFQQDLAGERLSERLWRDPDTDTNADKADLIGKALSGLRSVHEAGRASGLDRKVAALGNTPDWCARLVGMPQRLAAETGIKAPELPVERIAANLMPGRLSLLKWDARPANAMVGPDDSIAWFDWEHCGCRDVMDDAGWLLGDEYQPVLTSGDIDPVPALLPDDDPRSHDQAREDFLRFGILHSCVRLALILDKRREKQGWRDWQMCLQLDKVGATAEAFRRTAFRTADWADACDDLKPLAPWLRHLAETCPDD